MEKTIGELKEALQKQSVVVKDLIAKKKTVAKSDIYAGVTDLKKKIADLREKSIKATQAVVDALTERKKFNDAAREMKKKIADLRKSIKAMAKADKGSFVRVIAEEKKKADDIREQIRVIKHGNRDKTGKPIKK